MADNAPHDRQRKIVAQAPYRHDTIAAIATPPGRGAIGIVRISGPEAFPLSRILTGMEIPAPRRAALRRCLDDLGRPIDEGLLLCFPGPDSFTGEDVAEFQGHGGQVVLNLIWQRLLSLGARPARPGEFSERAFLNGRIDLAQAEAIADLIDAGSHQVAQGAMRSLQGEFSARVEILAERLMKLRVHVEASVDFVDEDEVDDLESEKIQSHLDVLRKDLHTLLHKAQQGRRLAQGAVIVIGGLPNVGKSSLLNRLAGDDTAIVTPIAGTTRDLLRTDILIEGIPVQVIDTAGIRETEDPVEREGVIRARQAMKQADLLIMMDVLNEEWTDEACNDLSSEIPHLRVRNKIDLSGEPPGLNIKSGNLGISVKTGEGMGTLVSEIVHLLDGPPQGEAAFTARARQIHALTRSENALGTACSILAEGRNIEFVAEELRQAQDFLGEITGQVTPDHLLGEIFSTFCIGK